MIRKNTMKQNSPKIPLSLLCVDHLLLGIELALKSSLYPGKFCCRELIFHSQVVILYKWLIGYGLGLFSTSTLNTGTPSDTDSRSCECCCNLCEYICASALLFISLYFLSHLPTLWLLCVIFNSICWVMRWGTLWRHTTYKWASQGFSLSVPCPAVSLWIYSHLLLKVASIMMAEQSTNLCV